MFISILISLCYFNTREYVEEGKLVNLLELATLYFMTA